MNIQNFIQKSISKKSICASVFRKGLSAVANSSMKRSIKAILNMNITCMKEKWRDKCK